MPPKSTPRPRPDPDARLDRLARRVRRLERQQMQIVELLSLMVETQHGMVEADSKVTDALQKLLGATELAASALQGAGLITTPAKPPSRGA